MLALGIMTTNLKRTTIYLTNEQHELLRRIASEKKSSITQLLRDAAVEILEDKEDIQEGLKSLGDKEGSLSWEEYQQQRKSRVTQ